MDFVTAIEMEFVGDRIIGNVEMPLGWQEIGCACKLSVCKRFRPEKYAAKFGVPLENTAAIGDALTDICMVRRAGVGIAFMPKDDDLSSAMKNVVRKQNMMQVARLLGATN